MANSRFYSSTAAVTALQVTANPTDASIQVASSVGFPGSFPFTLSLDYGAANEELVDVTSGGPTVFNVNRSIDGTSASTHNAGAVVRHVSSARDFTDSRTHEASSTGVHGVLGNIADTQSSQTLINKTLTNPTINSASLSGTLSGAPTFSGNVVYSSAVSFLGSIDSTRPTTGNSAFTSKVTGDATVRHNVTATGFHEWGDGTNPRDTNLYRNGVNALKTDDSFEVTLVLKENAATTSTVARQLTVGAEANPRLLELGDGTLQWGPGTTTSDVSLNRNAVGGLQVNGNLTTTGNNTTNGILTGNTVAATTTTWTSYTPTVTGQGSATFSTQVGWYAKLGKIVWFTAYLVANAAGTGSTTLTVALPSTPFRDGTGPNTTRQIVHGYFAPLANGTNTTQSSPGVGVIAAGGSGARLDSLQDGLNAQLTGNSIQNGTIITLQGFYREA